MVNTILARRVNHIVAKGDNPAWPKGSKSRGFSTMLLDKKIRIVINTILFLKTKESYQTIFYGNNKTI